MLLEEQNMRNERLKATRKAWTIEMNPGIKFQLGAQIKDDEEALAFIIQKQHSFSNKHCPNSAQTPSPTARAD